MNSHTKTFLLLRLYCCREYEQGYLVRYSLYRPHIWPVPEQGRLTPAKMYAIRIFILAHAHTGTLQHVHIYTDACRPGARPSLRSSRKIALSSTSLSPRVALGTHLNVARDKWHKPHAKRDMARHATRVQHRRAQMTCDQQLSTDDTCRRHLLERFERV